MRKRTIRIVHKAFNRGLWVEIGNVEVRRPTGVFRGGSRSGVDEPGLQRKSRRTVIGESGRVDVIGEEGRRGTTIAERPGVVQERRRQQAPPFAMLPNADSAESAFLRYAPSSEAALLARADRSVGLTESTSSFRTCTTLRVAAVAVLVDREHVPCSFGLNTEGLAIREPSCRRVCAGPFLSGHAYRVWATLRFQTVLAAHESSAADGRASTVSKLPLPTATRFSTAANGVRETRLSPRAHRARARCSS
jgi:hypothetical protein